MKIIEYKVQITDEAKQAISRPVRGIGGFQSVLTRLQNKLRGNTLTISADDVKRLRTYAKSYGDGGFQGRLCKLLGIRT